MNLYSFLRVLPSTSGHNKAWTEILACLKANISIFSWVSLEREVHIIIPHRCLFVLPPKSFDSSIKAIKMQITSGKLQPRQRRAIPKHPYEGTCCSFTSCSLNVRKIHGKPIVPSLQEREKPPELPVRRWEPQGAWNSPLLLLIRFSSISQFIHKDDLSLKMVFNRNTLRRDK